MKGLHDLGMIVDIYAKHGYEPSLKALQTALAQITLDVSPFIRELEWPRISTDAFVQKLEEVS